MSTSTSEDKSRGRARQVTLYLQDEITTTMGGCSETVRYTIYERGEQLPAGRVACLRYGERELVDLVADVRHKSARHASGVELVQKSIPSFHHLNFDYSYVVTLERVR